MSALFDKAHNQRVARHLAAKYLIELTPEECAEERRKAFDTIRRGLVKRGIKQAQHLTDEQLFPLIQKAMKNR